MKPYGAWTLGDGGEVSMSENEKTADVGRRAFMKNGAAVGAAALAGLGVQGNRSERRWDHSADVVIMGAGAAGLTAALRARDLGASVIVIDENTDVGGHAILSGGNIRLGGGTSIQKKFNIDDSADKVYIENTRPDHPQTRYNDREMIRAFADVTVAVFDFLVANGVKFLEAKPTVMDIDGMLTPRTHEVEKWPGDIKETINGANGAGFVRPLERSARAKGVQILLKHRLASIVRENGTSGRVIGITTTNLDTNATVTLKANRAVIGATGGSSSNLFVRTIYDSRLSEEYQVGCEPYSRQSGATEQLGMAIGASLGGTAIQTREARSAIQKTAFIGCRYGYGRWNPESPVFKAAGASGIAVATYQDVILVNQLGQRFYNEMVSGFERTAANNYTNFYDYVAAAMGSTMLHENGVLKRVGGPIWAVFDADAAKRERWNLKPPFIDPNGYFYTADTLAELATRIKSPYQKVPMPAANLEATVARYNSFVDQGSDPDFGKPKPQYKIQTPPFSAAWATPILHDTYAGLRVNGKWQVLDITGHVIPGFYAAGESAGGFALHGLARATSGGYIAATHAAAEKV